MGLPIRSEPGERAVSPGCQVVILTTLADFLERRKMTKYDGRTQNVVKSQKFGSHTAHHAHQVQITSYEVRNSVWDEHRPTHVTIASWKTVEPSRDCSWLRNTPHLGHPRVAGVRMFSFPAPESTGRTIDTHGEQKLLRHRLPNKNIKGSLSVDQVPFNRSQMYWRRFGHDSRELCTWRPTIN